MAKQRCEWVGENLLLIDYHDREWGIPVHDDNVLFEFLILEGMQAGLNWLTILKKRENYRQALDNFNPQKIALYTDVKVQELMSNPGIIRNRLKIQSIIANAKAFLNVQQDFGRFSSYLWSFVDNKPITNQWKNSRDLPARTDISDRMANELKKRGFKFVGSTICYALMQAVGMVNDHTAQCFAAKTQRSSPVILAIAELLKGD